MQILNFLYGQVKSPIKCPIPMADLITCHGIYVFLIVSLNSQGKDIILSGFISAAKIILAAKVIPVWCSDEGKKMMDGWKRICVKHSGNLGRN